MRHAVIMAGGAGVRLWPLSRADRPKQLLRLFNGSSLLRQAYDRLTGVFEPARVYVITTQSHLPLVAEELPEIPAENLLGEPVGRDTANAVGLSAAVIAGRDPEAVLGVFTADHVIRPTDCFQHAVSLALATAERQTDALVTMGIRPTRPDTNYGYVRRGERVGEGVYAVRKFTEKPNAAKALQYLSSGEYFWNSGLFVWKASTILHQLSKHLPQSYEAITQIGAAWESASRATMLDKLYPTLMKISVDFAVMERAERVLVVELGCHWVDVGSWPAIEAIMEPDEDGNVSACPDVLHLGSRGNVVVSEASHLVATIGVDDLVIVHSPDATLICKKRDASSIKELVANLRERYGRRFE